MLGRLRMNVNECIEAYMSLSQNVLRKKRRRVSLRGAIRGRFDSEALTAVLKDFIVQRSLPGDALLKDSPDSKCKV